jgi:hypothetical protein
MKIIIILFIIDLVRVHSLYIFNNELIPGLGLGDVNISDFFNCDNLLREQRDKCEDNYRQSVTHAMKKYNFNASLMYVKREVCCGFWKQKSCIIKAALKIWECGERAAKRYQLFSENPRVKQELSEKCSDYAENSEMCNIPTFPAFIWLLIFLSLISIIVLFYLLAELMLKHYSLIVRSLRRSSSSQSSLS